MICLFHLPTHLWLFVHNIIILPDSLHAEQPNNRPFKLFLHCDNIDDLICVVPRG